MSAAQTRVTAVLGPTNTGKTYLAIERMLGHASGMIGFPLRLLARENYDRVVAKKGRATVALITGEEKILPPHASYFICTVEAMPLDHDVEFLAVDEIQLAADPERGHVFTDRLLHARGKVETMFLGAATVRGLVHRLIPNAAIVTRPRFSRLAYSGATKISRLPRRSAVVAFSVQDVYVLAELVRRQRGGAAVVMGALSPRARNAQVAMYQAGEVDYLIATDAIGMGLNMDVDHVAFAANRKFDGRFPRKLTAPELAQIAGRAGRHMNDGTFGVTADLQEIEPELVEAIEAHEFDPVKGLYWRNRDLSFNSIRDLQMSLEERPREEVLIRKREAEDQRALESLARMPEVVALAQSPARLRLLWDVCQIPDFHKNMTDSHPRLLAQIFQYLARDAERLPMDWVKEQMTGLDRLDGGIDTLVNRISQVRTWTYVSHRNEWVDDPADLQQRARSIEDRLSDALHERLTERFVDRRAAVLSQKLTDQEDLVAAVKNDGEVIVEGHRVGEMRGLRFYPDDGQNDRDKIVLAAARRVLPQELERRVGQLVEAPDGTLDFDDAGQVTWRGAAIAKLTAGHDRLHPRLEALCDDSLDGARRERVEARLAAWFADRLAADAPNLVRLRDALAQETLDGGSRGILFQAIENLGSVAFGAVSNMVKDLSDEQRRALGQLGLRFGTENIYLGDMLKPRAIAMRARLWAAHAGNGYPPPPEGRVSVDRDPTIPVEFDRAIGYARVGGKAVRIDMLERVAAAIRRVAREGPFKVNEEMLSLLGATHEEMAVILGDLGYRKNSAEDDGTPVFQKRGKTRPRGKPRGRRDSAEGTAQTNAAAPPVDGAATATDSAAAPPSESQAEPPAAATGEAGSAKPRGDGQKPRKKNRRGKPPPSGQNRSPRERRAEPKIDPHSPFAVLANLKLKK